MPDDLFLRRVRVPDHILAQQLPDEETVLLDTAGERYFGLDATATAMWRALAAAETVEDAYRRLVDEFEVEPERLRGDLDDLVRNLLQRGLLELS